MLTILPNLTNSNDSGKPPGVRCPQSLQFPGLCRAGKMSLFLLPTGMIVLCRGRPEGTCSSGSGLVALHDDGNRVALAAIDFFCAALPLLTATSR